MDSRKQEKHIKHKLIKKKSKMRKGSSSSSSSSSTSSSTSSSSSSTTTSSSTTSSSSENESGSDTMECVDTKESKSAKPERDEWMGDSSFVSATYSKSDLLRKSRKQLQKEEEALREKKLLEQRELNPYWKKNGSGLPSTSVVAQSSVTTSSAVGDGGYGWLKKAYQRVQEQAKEEGRSMEDVAAERWGSLEILESKLKDARKQVLGRLNRSPSPRGSKRQHSSKGDNEDGYHKAEKYRTDGDSFSKHRSTNYKKPAEEYAERYKNTSYDYHKSSDKNQKSSARFQVPKDDNVDYHYSSERNRSSSSSWKKKDESVHSDKGRRDEDRGKYDGHGRSYADSSERSKRFQTPKNDSDDDYQSSKGNYNSSSIKHEPSWKKAVLSTYTEKSGKELVNRDGNKSLHESSSSIKFEDHHKHYKNSDRFQAPKEVSSSSNYRSSSFQHPSSPKMKRSASESSSSSFQPLSSSKMKEFVSEASSSRTLSKDGSSDRDKSPEDINSGADIKKEKDTASSTDDERSMEEDEKELKEELILNQNEMNYLAARVLRAKFAEDYELAANIQKEFVAARNKRKEVADSGEELPRGPVREEVFARKIDKFPLPKSLRSIQFYKKKHRRKNIHVIPTMSKCHELDEKSINYLYEKEKKSTIGDEMKMYFAAASSSKDALIDGCEDDVSGKISKKMNTFSTEEKDIEKYVQDYKKKDAALEKCRFCIDKPALLKHTIICKGTKVFLCAPAYKSLVEGHCFIVPMTHVPSTLHLDENEYSEIQAFKRGLTKMFEKQKKSFVFMETSLKHNFYPHAVIECIPMPVETADLAPIYFKKAIEDSEYEWSNNKKLIDLYKKTARKALPKGLPYFCAEFGLSGGFGHIIEDEKRFPRYFGKEIVGGMMEIDSYDLVKIKDEDWQQICRKVVKLHHLWYEYKEYFTC